MKLLANFWHDVLKRPYKLTKIIDEGSGQLVLLIHGLASSSHTWQPLVDQIDTSRWRVVGYDLLGFGRSPKPQNSLYTLNDHAASILASLDKKHKRQKIIIIGHSMGCLIATHIAANHPSLIEQIILYEPPLFADSPEFRSHARRKNLYFAFYEQLLQRPRLLFKYSKLVAKISEGRVLSVNSSSWLPFERSLKNTVMQKQAYDELKIIAVPTDIIYGSFDLMVTRTELKKMLQANKYINFHLVNEMHDVTKRASKYIIKLLKPVY